jgi:hypothetical protein
MPSSDFERLDQAAAQGSAAVLEQLIDQLRSRHQYHELFEALKMRVRSQLNLPLAFSDAADDLDESRRTKLEEGLLSACREVGFLLLQDGQVREGWMYLRPVGERVATADALAKIPANQDNVDALIEVCLNEGVDVRRGFELVLEHYGTCNAITTYESSLARHGRPDQQSAAELLVRHIHAELLRSVAADIGRQEGQPPQQSTLRDLVANREWLFGEYSYHLDTTHLASTVRIARTAENPDVLRLALDLTEYGRRLAKQFQYKGEEPFAEIYPSHALYFSARLGENVDQAIEYFRQRAASLPVAEFGSLPMETLVQLLEHDGRYEEAIQELMLFAAQEQRPRQVVPLLMDLAAKAGDYTPVAVFCRRHEDLLGYGTVLARQFAS